MRTRKPSSCSSRTRFAASASGSRTGLSERVLSVLRVVADAVDVGRHDRATARHRLRRWEVPPFGVTRTAVDRRAVVHLGDQAVLGRILHVLDPVRETGRAGAGAEQHGLEDGHGPLRARSSAAIPSPNPFHACPDDNIATRGGRSSIGVITWNLLVSIAPDTRCTSVSPIVRARSSNHGAMKILRSGRRHVASTRSVRPLQVSWCWIR